MQQVEVEEAAERQLEAVQQLEAVVRQQGAVVQQQGAVVQLAALARHTKVLLDDLVVPYLLADF